MDSEIVGRVKNAIGPKLRINILRGGASTHEEIDTLIEWVSLVAASCATTARIAALEEALRPFAAGANELSSEWRDEDNLAVVYDEDPENVGLFRFNVGDLRRARAVLNEK